MTSDVVYRKENKWFIGHILDNKLRKKKQISKLSDVPDVDNYLTLKQWIDVEKSDINSDVFLKALKIDRLYIKKENTEVLDDKTVLKQIKEFEKEWWSKYNELCIDCVKKCKQSYHVEILKCKREIKNK